MRPCASGSLASRRRPSLPRPRISLQRSERGWQSKVSMRWNSRWLRQILAPRRSCCGRSQTPCLKLSRYVGLRRSRRSGSSRQSGRQSNRKRVFETEGLFSRAFGRTIEALWTAIGESHKSCQPNECVNALAAAHDAFSSEQVLMPSMASIVSEMTVAQRLKGLCFRFDVLEALYSSSMISLRHVS